MSGGRQRGPPGSRGCFVTFEGVEGSGKSTQLRLLARRLEAGGADVVVTKEPGGTEIGKGLRALLLSPTSASMAPLAELMLYTADRAQHLAEVVEPALGRGAVVLCDRFLDATLAYQGSGRGLPASLVLDLHRHAPLDLRPDRTILLDADPETALPRARRRNQRLGLDDSEGRFEEEDLEFHRRVRAGYLELAAREPERFRVVATDGNVEAVHEAVIAALADRLPALAGGETA